ncbi:hypothetical protein NQ318_010260 [Aromia moschata]|uniref:Inositol hexakisphosphate and diphosphoinositol-pentakisphosphate kinase n=1 Tax=Aromia moschata TaxID=1265417 RepID=A0AAV8YI88_9CUCU|nr:hypothetical protein NQ318_010260 [Aromia moschata]
MTAAAFAKGLLALEGELTPILVQMVKSANTNGLLDNDCDSSKYQNMCKARLHELMQLDRDFTQEDREKINPCNSSSIADALDFVKNPVKCCKHVHELIKNLMEIVQVKKEDMKTKDDLLDKSISVSDAILYHGETWELMGRRWGKIEKDFYTKNKTFDISKIPDIYDCIKYDLQHNQHTLQFEQAEELYTYAKYLADIVIPQFTIPPHGYCLRKEIEWDISGINGVHESFPSYAKSRSVTDREEQGIECEIIFSNHGFPVCNGPGTSLTGGINEYGLTAQEKLTIGQGICTPLLKKIRADLQRNIEESGEETVNRLNPRYSHGVSSPGRHVRTRLYFTSESHIHSLMTVLRYGGLVDRDEQWRRAMEYVSMVSELNYMSQIVIMLYEDPTKDPCSEERFHIELHFSPGVNCCVQKNLPPGPGFRPHSRNESAASKNPSVDTSATATPEDQKSQCSPRIDEEAEIAIEEEKFLLDPPRLLETPPEVRIPSADTRQPTWQNASTRNWPIRLSRVAEVSVSTVRPARIQSLVLGVTTTRVPKRAKLLPPKHVVFDSFLRLSSKLAAEPLFFVTNSDSAAQNTKKNSDSAAQNKKNGAKTPHSRQKESRTNIFAGILNIIDTDPGLLDTVTLKGTRFESVEAVKAKSDGGSEPADRSGLPALLSTMEKSDGAV